MLSAIEWFLTIVKAIFTWKSRSTKRSKTHSAVRLIFTNTQSPFNLYQYFRVVFFKIRSFVSSSFYLPSTYLLTDVAEAAALFGCSLVDRFLDDVCHIISQIETSYTSDWVSVKSEQVFVHTSPLETVIFDQPIAITAKYRPGQDS